jgi:glutamate carboxypeptidase
MSSALDRCIASIAARAAAHESLLRAWVEQNSYSANRSGCDAMAAMLEEAFSFGGLRVSRVAPADGTYGEHVVIETPAAASAPSHVLCIGHHDTVFPPGAFEGYRREGDVARGPGVLDMKGGLLVVRAALEALDDAGALGDLALKLVSVSDEEVGSPTSAALVRSLARGARAALGFESGRENDTIITARKGTGSARLVAHGRAAHAGNAHAEGANAIWALARFIDRAQALTDYSRGLTINAGVVRGGQAKNTVPEHAEALVDLRFLELTDGEALEGRLRAIADDAAASVPGTRIDLERKSWRLPLVRTDASASLARDYGVHQIASGLAAGECPLQGGGSDAANAAAEGVPAIDGLGPRGAGYHTKAEHIFVSTLWMKAEALVRFLL